MKGRVGEFKAMRMRGITAALWNNSWRYLLGLAGAALILLTAPFWLSSIGFWLSQPVRAKRVDAIVVLGGSRARTLHGIARFKEGMAHEFWHTGAVADTANDYARSSIELVMQSGMPAEEIHLLSTTSTWEDGEAIAALAMQRNVESILVVTDWTHSRRGLCVLRHHLAGSGVTILFEPPAEDYSPDTWWQTQHGRAAVLSELLKLVYYGARYDLAPWRC